MSFWMRAVVLVAGAKTLAGVAAFVVGFATGIPLDGHLPAWITVAIVLAYAGAAAILVVGGAAEAAAASLGAFLLTIASAFSDVLAHGGHPLGGVSAVAAAIRVDAFLPYFFWQFARAFPGVMAPRGLATLTGHLLRASFVVGLALLIVNAAVDVGALAPGPAGAAPLAALSRRASGGLYWPLLFVMMLPIAPVLAVRTQKVGLADRRRVELFVASVLIGLLPVTMDVVLRATSRSWARLMTHPLADAVVTVFVVSTLLSVPFTTAYAVLVERVIDVRLLVRSALQYALARYSVLALVSAPFLLLAWFVYSNRLATVQELLFGRLAMILVVGTALGILVLRSRKRVLTALDRRFFREQYDAQQILSSLVNAARRADSTARLAGLLGDEIDRAFHVKCVTVLIRDAPGAWFLAPDGSSRPLACDSLLVRLLSGSDDPLDVDLSTASSPLRRLGSQEQQWLLDGQYCILVPLRDADAHVIGLLALGAKKSDVPYTPQDRRLLAAVGASGGICLESRLARETPAMTSPEPHANAEPAPDPPAVECSSCGAVSVGPGARCACGTVLVPAVVPSVLAGKFRVERRLGAGGMGVVYQAEDLALRRMVAVKTLPRLDPGRAYRLHREAQSMARVTHPNLELIYGVETWCDRPVLIVEFLEGGTLSDRLAEGPIPLSEILGLGITLSEGLHALHRAGVLHRDIKPSNIGFTAEGSAKLMDFGIAKLMAGDAAPVGQEPATASKPDATSTVEIVGTPAYMSPEAIRREAPGPSFDLWSLAVVLFEAFTGTNPFLGQSWVETVARLQSGVVPDPRAHVSQCPAAFAEFLEASLAPEPAARPLSALDFRNGLIEVRQASGTLAVPQTQSAVNLAR